MAARLTRAISSRRSGRMKPQYLYDLFMELLPNFYEPSANVEPWQWNGLAGKE
jgi:hypothetical protein